MRAARVPILCAAALLLCQPACAQVLGHGADDGISLWRVFFALLLCVALAVFAAYALKARSGGTLPFLALQKSERRLRLVETLRVGPQVELCIVSCDGRELLMSSSPQGLRLVRELSARRSSVVALVKPS